MRKLFGILASLIASASLQAAAPPKYVAVGNYATNTTYVSKGGNDTTAAIGRIDLPFLTISNAVQASLAPAEVKVAPGLYNESVILKNGVNLNMPSGVIVSQSVVGLAVLFDNGSNVTNSVFGNPKIIHTGDGSAADGINLTGASDVTVNSADIQTFATAGSGVQTASGSNAKLKFYGRVRSRGLGCQISGAVFYFNGDSYGTNDYGIIVSESGSSNYITGSVGADLNSAVHIGGGFVMIENAVLISFDNSFGWAVEHSGGSGLVKDSVLISAREEAIGKYGGTLLTLSGCMLTAGTNVSVSIDNDGTGSHGEIQIQTPCWANKPPNPAMNITSGSLIVSNTTTWKNPQVFKSVHDLTNIVARTNGNTWFPAGAASYSTLTTNAIGATGYTNNQTINQTAYVTATAVAFTVKDRSQATLYVSPVLTATISVNLQPGWAITAASGLAGPVLPW